MRILNVDQEKICIRFQKISGNQWSYLKHVNELRKEVLASFIDTAQPAPKSVTKPNALEQPEANAANDTIKPS